ncbi:hypothetical protein CDAR_579131 [Caerostris darwini]|uniref:Uncharacterized protein n=1 Tax=Caerostris darwini TaxID=1538125 RepID=A0AAV4RUZ1_9ARAC|nr:hypothetical protein CDAR_579131 [Caerostris darwini]
MATLSPRTSRYKAISQQLPNQLHPFSTLSSHARTCPYRGPTEPENHKRRTEEHRWGIREERGVRRYLLQRTMANRGLILFLGIPVSGIYPSCPFRLSLPWNLWGENRTNVILMKINRILQESRSVLSGSTPSPLLPTNLYSAHTDIPPRNARNVLCRTKTKTEPDAPQK